MNIKYLEEYTKEELHNLTEEAKEHIFAIECAARGVALPSALLEVPADPTERPELKEDLTVYQLKGGYSSRDQYFNTSEEAQAVADLINKTSIKVESSYSSGKTRLYLGGEKSEYDTLSVEAINVYSAAKWAELSSEIKKYDVTKKERDAVISENQTTRRAHDTIWDEINRAVSEANHEFNTAARLKKQFDEYKTLANNDIEVAKKFLLKAHGNDLDSLSDEALKEVGVTRQEVETRLEPTVANPDDEDILL